MNLLIASKALWLTFTQKPWFKGDDKPFIYYYNFLLAVHSSKINPNIVQEMKQSIRGPIP